MLILSCTADENADSENFFDFNLIFYDTSSLKKESPAASSESGASKLTPLSENDILSVRKTVRKYKDSISLSVGKIRVICLVKFVNELIDFVEPIILAGHSPINRIAEQVKEQVKCAFSKHFLNNSIWLILLNLRIKLAHFF